MLISIPNDQLAPHLLGAANQALTSCTTEGVSPGYTPSHCPLVLHQATYEYQVWTVLDPLQVHPQKHTTTVLEQHAPKDMSYRPCRTSTDRGGAAGPAEIRPCACLPSSRFCTAPGASPTAPSGHKYPCPGEGLSPAHDPRRAALITLMPSNNSEPEPGEPLASMARGLAMIGYSLKVPTDQVLARWVTVCIMIVGNNMFCKTTV